MKVTNILRSEHEVILDVLAALESISRTAATGAGLDQMSAQQALDVLCGLGDRCHHGKEEQLFFPALAAHGLPRDVGPLAVMMGEHDEGRAPWRAWSTPWRSRNSRSSVPSLVSRSQVAYGVDA
jgi:hemerythrin-like domain-containing protein